VQIRVKIKSRQSREVILGAVTGPLHKPSSLVAGLISGKRLIIAGRSTRLTAVQSAQLAEVVTEAAGTHPWPAEIGSGAFGQRQKVAITRIEPLLVVEVAADTALEGGRFRHPLRYLRIRPDLAPADVAPVG